MSQSTVPGASFKRKGVFSNFEIDVKSNFVLQRNNICLVRR